MMAAGRELWAALHLLDRQIVDAEGISTAKVDDLEFSTSDDPGGLPVLSGLLCGAAALAGRFSPSLAREVERLRRVFVPVDAPGPARIDMTLVKRIGSDIELTARRQDLEVTRLDRWLARNVLSHLPGSGIKGEEARDEAQ
jgi:hypothetical protein